MCLSVLYPVNRRGAQTPSAALPSARQLFFHRHFLKAQHTLLMTESFPCFPMRHGRILHLSESIQSQNVLQTHDAAEVFLNGGLVVT